MRVALTIAGSDSGAGELKRTTRAPGRDAITLSRSSAIAASESARRTSARSQTSDSSRTRRSGMVATAIPPAFNTANQHAISIGWFGARSSTRLPGTTPRSVTRTFAMRFAISKSCR